MYFLFTLFIGSLVGMTILIGRKLLILRRGETFNQENIVLEIPFIEEIKSVTGKSIKKIGYVGLVTSIRMYVRSSTFIKNQYQETKENIRNFRNRNKTMEEISDQKEISRFLKVISDYKHKIRVIKHKIKEEEQDL